MRNTLRVGKIIKMKNRMVAGATQRNTNRLRLLSDFIDKPFLSTGIQKPKKAEAVKTASAGQGLGSCFRMQLRSYSMMLARIWSLADLMPSIHCCSVVLPETRELTGSKNTVRTSTPGIAVKEAKLPIAAFAPLS